METKSPQTCPYTATLRRNPDRKARPTTTAKCQQQVSVPSPPSAPPEVPSFPIDEILAMEVPKNPNTNPNSDSASENLRVFLRIRPLLPSSSPAKDQNPKPRAKNAWPQNPAKKNSARERAAKKKNSGCGVCITVNDSQSVTLSPPLALQESKRIKSEVYEGFSHVFAPDSSQEQVFEKMVCPLVDDFLRGKSGMLAALGPSGSGKTHTVFGCPRDPGVVPRTLQRIFGPNSNTASGSRRSFSISIFEINSERGKGEKLFDLCFGGAELSMQQSTIKGLQEVIVSDFRKAESLVAQAMLRRLTAMTNSNSQSSRSQCIINIRSVAKNSDEEDGFPANNAVLSIIDLAGAEREKKTGNQGARLLESNFINNTSMVFGLCLRSLLEHQKNPKRPLQKHCQNSLLTRYLREYLEGKKRMTLILTVKSGEEDYLDTTYLLRQASPFMRIRFENVEERASISCNKRQSHALSRREQPKRMRFSGSGTCAIEEKKTSEDECHAPVQGCSKEETRIMKSEFLDSAPSEVNNVELAKSGRSYQILQNFAKALWTVLKQHGKKLKAAEHEIQHLTENLKLEKTRNIELETKLEDLKSFCTCSQQKSIEVTLAESGINSEARVELDGLHSSKFDESNMDLCSSIFSLPDCRGTTRKNGSTPRQDHAISSQKSLDIYSSNGRAFEADRTSDKCDSDPEQNPDIFSQVTCWDVKILDGSSLYYESPQHIYQVKEGALSLDSKELECVDNEPEYDTPLRSLDVDVVGGSSLHVEISHQKYPIEASFCGSGHDAEDLHDSRCFETDDICTTADATDYTLSLPQPLCMCRDDSCLSVELDHQVGEEDQELLNLPKIGKVVVASSEVCTAADIVDASESRIQNPEKFLDPSTSVKEDVVVTENRSAANASNSEQRTVTHKAGKSKRRLSPAPSKLLRDFNTMDIGNRSEKPKEVLNLPKTGKVDVVSSGSYFTVDFVDGSEPRIEKPEESLNPLTSVKKDLAGTQDSEAANAPNTEQRVFDTRSKGGKPKRRLLPASSALLRDFNTLDIGDKSEKPKGTRGGKKFSGDERNRTQGSISLLRLLNSNIRV